MGLKRVRNRRDDAVARVDWQALEGLLARHYTGQGYAVEHVGTGGTGARYDGGIDLKLRRADEYIVVQVKHWNAYKVPHNDVHQLLGVMVNEGATGAILVTSGEFTQAAKEAANRQGHVRLIDGNELRSMLGPDAMAAVAVSADRVAEFADAMSAPSREERQTRVRSRTPAAIGGAGPWLAVAAIGLMVFALLMWGVMKKTEGTAGPSTPTDVSVIPTYRPDADSRISPTSPRPAAQDAQAADPCAEMVDHASRTYIDHCAGTTPPTAPTAAEIRAQQRRADEAAKLLEATTPEM